MIRASRAGEGRSLALALSATAVVNADSGNERDEDHRGGGSSVQPGPRPFFLINEMEDGPLKRQLQRCTAGPFKQSDFSIGHRGAALQFPEHTRESYEAGARLGTPSFRTDVYAGPTSGHLLTFAESIELFKTLGASRRRS